MIFLQNCKQLQRYPFFVVVVSNGLGSYSKWVECHVFYFFVRFSVFREYRMVSDRVWTVLKSHHSPWFTYSDDLASLAETSGDYVWRLPSQAIFNCSSPQCLHMRGATQPNAATLATMAITFFWGGGGGFHPKCLIWCLKHLTRLASRGSVEAGRVITISVHNRTFLNMSFSHYLVWKNHTQFSHLRIKF